MRVALTGTDRNFRRVVSKIRGRGFTVAKEDDRRNLIVFNLPKVDSEFLYDLLEQETIIRRDIQYDLD